MQQQQQQQPLNEREQREAGQFVEAVHEREALTQHAD